METAGTDETAPVCLPERLSGETSLERVERTPLSGSLTLSGQVTVDPDRVFRIFPAAGGTASDVRVRAGDAVTGGQVLAVIQSPEIAALHREEMDAEARFELAERNLAVVKSLIESGVYAARDRIEAERELETARAELARIRQRKELKGAVDGESAWQVTAPEQGFVIDRSVNPGMRILSDTSEPLFTISSLDRVWVIANIYESDIRSVQSGDRVTVELPAWPDDTFTGEILRLSNVLDPDRRILEAVIELPNPDYRLKPGMFATVRVEYERGVAFSAVSAESLVFDDNRTHAVIYRDDCDLELREVRIHGYGNGLAYIESGLEEGESVVSRHQLFLYNEILVNRPR